tara:strand:- start:12873 stop:13289 length:417 start_codon:yes stop_codon:yes gene_type:complete
MTEKTNICVELYGWYTIDNHKFIGYGYNWIDKEVNPVGGKFKELENVARSVLSILYKRDIDPNISVRLTDGCASIESSGSYKFKRYTKKPEQSDQSKLEKLLHDKKIIADIKKQVDMVVPEYRLEFKGKKCKKTIINK